MRGFCPKCHTMQQLTKHHVFPSRYYRKHNESVLMLCEECHREIEALLPHNRKLHKDEYLAITSAWLLGMIVSVPRKRREYDHMSVSMAETKQIHAAKGGMR